MEECYLIEFDQVTEEAYNDYMSEWEAAGELIVPWATKRQFTDFADMMKKWEEDTTALVYEKGFVPATLYFYVCDDRVIGAIHLRHELNESLAYYGGHIGYGIRPSMRGKGYGKKMLADLLDHLRQGDNEKVLITCDKDNVASAKTIEACGGVLEAIADVDGNLVRRYWVYL